MLRTKNAPWRYEPISTCPSRCSADGLSTAAQKSISSARPLRMTKPAGVCCHELATTIQTEENTAPNATIQLAKKCVFAETLSQPNTSTARKPDSRKNAKMPSAASAAPKMSPTYREYVAQFVPNWNSIVMPVATPTAKLRAKIFVQNFAAAAYCGSCVRRNFHSSDT